MFDIIDHIKSKFAERKELRKQKAAAEKLRRETEAANKLKLREDHEKKREES